MIRIIDKTYSYVVEVFGVPPFPAHLEEAALLRGLAGQGEDEAFVKWWAQGCLQRGFAHRGYPCAEEWKHARALLARYTLKQLQGYAVDFWSEYAKPNMRGVALMRSFRHYLPMIEAGVHGTES